MAGQLTYRKGPLGYAVLLDGKPFGRIRDVRQHGGWQVSVPTLRPSGFGRGKTLFPTVRAAKAAIANSLNRSE
jgi:hypothetical protein